jgi:ATP-binding cassette subfamily C (CFTR/MRP) protein 2
MYVGPALITTFVDFKAGAERGELWFGLTLVLVLAVAKSVDVLASHQFSFQCTNLGMAIRSTLITVVYRKGIRLTSAARGVHGVGQIVNYMSVDVQVMSDVIQQVHNLWLLPIQVVTALGILYVVVGWSMLAGLTTMVGIVVLATWSSKAQKRFQGHIMAAKDARIKATSEALNAMKVIKLQAWETHFRGRIAELREKEYHWILQFMYQVAKSTVFVWCAPTMVSVVTFACCVLVEGTALTSGQVFTAVATFRILQEPIRNFPNTLIAVTQAQVSLARLEKYLRSEELDSNAVDRTNPIPNHNNSAVTVQSASFSWTPDQPESPTSPSTITLRNIDLEIKKGALVAVVGTVGSGKSSLLACMLGEMPKLHGKVCTITTTTITASTISRLSACFTKPIHELGHKAGVRVRVRSCG